MRRTSTRTAALLAATAAALVTSAPAASARPAQPFSYEVSYDDFAVCGEPASLEGRVFGNSRSTGAESGNYTATFIDRTTGTLTVGDDTYRYHQVSHFSELEAADGETRTERLSGWIRLAGSGPLAGTKLEQRIHTVTDANGVQRVDTYISSFCS
jgi:hypothetical protein